VPDLIVEYSEGKESIINPTGFAVVSSKPLDGTHDRDGILVLKGPGVQSDKTLDGELVDIMPTVLAYLDVPIPRHVDGSVLEQAFVTPMNIRYHDVAIDSSEEEVYSDDEQAKVEKQLTDLGYL